MLRSDRGHRDRERREKMNRACITMADEADFDLPDGFDLADLFPEHYNPAVSGDDTLVDLDLFAGKARCLFGDAEIVCFFEFYQEDDEFFENDEYANEGSRVGGLMEYVVEKLTRVCEREVVWRLA